jgi:hypothetical protein
MLSALELGRQLRSARSVTYVAQFRQRLPRFADTQAVRELADRAADSSLWIAAAQATYQPSVPNAFRAAP